MLFRQGDYSNSEYKQSFKEKIEVLEAYNGKVLFGNIPGATAREIATLELDAAVEGDLEKAQASASKNTWRPPSYSFQTGVDTVSSSYHSKTITLSNKIITQRP